jgi:hypothetical protein
VLHTIYTQYPDASITALLRNPPKTFSTLYPSVKIVKGTYDDTDLLTSTAAASDIVVHCGDSDHLPSLQALIAGLLTRPSPGHLLHLSGTGILSDWATPSSLGHLNPQIYSDVTSLSAIRSLPSTALHRPTEELLHNTAATHPTRINIAIMCPPDIYGRGLGPGKTHSALIPLFVRESLARGSPFFVAPGTNTRSWVHIRDLMRVYVHVVDAALAGDSAAFNENGYYFAGTQEASQVELAQRVGALLAARGRVQAAEPREVSVEELDGLVDYPAFPNLGRYLFASNSRSRADRAARWGYKGEAVGLWEALEGEVDEALKVI